MVFTNWGTSDRAEVRIHAESSGLPGTVLQTLVTPRTITNNSTASFTTSETLTLEKDTTYFVSVRASVDWFLVRTTDSDAEDSGGQAGWSLHNRAHATSAAVPQWTQSILEKKTKVTIKGAVNQAANTAATGAPTISGPAAQGGSLSVAKGTIADTDDLPSTAFPEGYSVQWLRIEGGGATVISGATSTSYTLQSDDLRKRVRARVSFTDGAGHTETRTSAVYPPDPFTVENPLAVNSAASGYYTDASLDTVLSGPLINGADIYLKVVHNEKLSHTAGDGADARPELFYKIGADAAVGFDIVDFGTTLESGDCKPKGAGRSREYQCRYTVAEGDMGAFVFEVGTHTVAGPQNTLASRYTHATAITVDGTAPTVDASESGYYSDEALMTVLSGLQPPGTAIYTKIKFSENVEHIEGTQGSGRPALRYRVESDRSAESYDIVGDDAALESGQCKRKSASDTSEYVCLYETQRYDNGTFRFEVEDKTRDLVQNALSGGTYNHDDTLTVGVIPGTPGIQVIKGDTRVRVYMLESDIRATARDAFYDYRYAAGITIPENTPWETGSYTESTVLYHSLTNGTQYTFEVRARTNIGTSSIASTMFMPGELACNAPTLTNRREFWSATMSVGTLETLQGNAYTGRTTGGFRNNNDERFGTLTTDTVTSGRHSYTIEELTSLREPNGSGEPIRIRFSEGRLARHIEEGLQLHICEQGINPQWSAERSYEEDPTGERITYGELALYPTLRVALSLPELPPQRHEPVPDPGAQVGREFTYQIPEETFSDPNNDELSYAITRGDGTAFASDFWLSVDNATRTLNGTPTETGTVSVKVTVSDGTGRSVSDDFNIKVGASDVCQRTPQVRDAIVGKVPGVSDCIGVTEAHLGAITGRLVINPVEELREGDLDGLGQLEQLLVVGDLRTFPSNILDELASLVTLDWGQNAITELPEGLLDKVTKLEDVNFASNRLTSVRASLVAKLQVLDSLSLSANSLTTLPTGFLDHNPMLTGLYINGNKTPLTLKSGMLDKVTRLEELWLAGTKLTGIPEGFLDKTVELEHLQIQRNGLTELPEGLLDHTRNIETLRIEGNEIETLPDALLQKLNALHTFKAQDNPGAPFRPTADAGTDRTVQYGTKATLLATATGAWGDRVTWEWSQVDGPNSETRATSPVSLATDPSNAAIRTFTVPSTERDLHFMVLAKPIPRAFTNDGTANSEPDWVTLPSLPTSLRQRLPLELVEGG